MTGSFKAPDSIQAGQGGQKYFPPPLSHEISDFKIGCHDLRYFFKFVIIQEKLIPHVFRCQDHILTHPMGTRVRDFHSQKCLYATSGFKDQYIPVRLSGQYFRTHGASYEFRERD